MNDHTLAIDVFVVDAIYSQSDQWGGGEWAGGLEGLHIDNRFKWGLHFKTVGLVGYRFSGFFKFLMARAIMWVKISLDRIFDSNERWIIDLNLWTQWMIRHTLGIDLFAVDARTGLLGEWAGGLEGLQIDNRFKWGLHFTTVGLVGYSLHRFLQLMTRVIMWVKIFLRQTFHGADRSLHRRALSHRVGD